jgi:signal transduction histidine kinase
VYGPNNDLGVWLTTLPATPRQRRHVLVSLAALLGLFCLAAPFATRRLPESDGFIPAIQAIIFVTDLTTAALLFTQVWLGRSRALLVLANAYLFTALIVVVHTLTFPRALAPQGVVGAGLQTTGWLHIIWHFCFPAAVILYILRAARGSASDRIRAPITSVVGWCAMGVAALVCGILWFLTAADALLPPLFIDRLTFSPLVVHAGAFDTIVCAIALLLLLVRKGSVLDQWLAISVAATTAEMAMVTFFSAGRFDVGWYAVRIFGVVSSAAVLLALLIETTRLYAKLAVALRALELERDNKLLSAQAATAAMAHQIRQPLTAMAANGGAALLFLQRMPPDLGEVRACVESMLEGCRHASEAIEGIRSLFRQSAEPGRPIQLNGIVTEAVQSCEEELRRSRVETILELTPGLPTVRGHRAQLHELVANLINNAIEALGSTDAEGPRLVTVKTEQRDPEAVAVDIQDNGPGIDPQRLERIFEAFATTKPQGTGLGLAICRMIVEHHGGKLTVSSDGRSGALFRFVLPVIPAEGDSGLPRLH